MFTAELARKIIFNLLRVYGGTCLKNRIELITCLWLNMAAFLGSGSFFVVARRLLGSLDRCFFSVVGPSRNYRKKTPVNGGPLVSFWALLGAVGGHLGTFGSQIDTKWFKNEQK